MSTPPKNPPTPSPFAARTAAARPATPTPVPVPVPAQTPRETLAVPSSAPAPTSQTSQVSERGSAARIVAVVALLIVAGAGVWWWTGRETQKNTAGAAPAKPAVTGVAKQAEAPGARAARLAKEFAALQVRAAELGLADAALAEATMVAGQAQAIEGGAGAAQAAEAWARATDMAGPVVLARVTTLHDAEAAGLREVNLDDHTAAPVRSLARARREANEAARRGAWAEAVARLDEARGLIAPASRAVAEKLAEAGGAAAARGDEAMATFFHVQALRLDAKLESSREHLYRHKYKLGQILRTPAGQELAYAPPGQFLRGSATGEAGRDADETQQQVTLTRGFFIAVSETTQREWDRVFGAGAAARTLRTAKAKPSTVSPELPMHSVTWEQATEYCRRLSELDGMAFRLPTEAEWEHACRAGTTTAFNLGVDGLSARDANIDDGSADAPLAPRAPGASGRANAWGLRDMHGNVWEWCADWSAPYPTEEAATRDPTGPLRESLGRIDLALKVVRGGGWNAPANDARSANRWEYSPAVATDYIGFRVVHDPDLAKP